MNFKIRTKMSNNIFFERGQMADKPNNYLWNDDCLELTKNFSLNPNSLDLGYKML